jgi:DNA-binding IclR family transcriptional regulator
MAFWQKKTEEFEAMDRVIQAEPGISLAKLAEKLHAARSTIIRRMPSLEEAGYLYYEDEEGGIWPFKKR